MALTTTTPQDQAAYALFGVAYSSLTTAQKAQIDTPSARILRQLEEAAEYATMTAATGNAPDEWAMWYATRVIEEAALTARPSIAAEARKNRIQAERDAQNWYSRIAVTADFSGAGNNSEIFAYTYQNMRIHVLSVLAKSEKQFWPNTESIDNATKWALTHLWGKAGWVYRRRQAVLSFTSADPTVMTVSSGLESGETIDSLSSFYLHNNTSGYENHIVKWVGADAMAALKTQDGSATGTPKYFRIRAAGDTWTWLFSPHPDATYTYRCEVLVAQAANATGTGSTGKDSTTQMGKFAVEHMQVLKDLVLAKVRVDHYPSQYRGEYDAALSQVDAMFADQQSVGAPETRGAVTDVFADWRYVGGSEIFGGGN